MSEGEGKRIVKKIRFGEVKAKTEGIKCRECGCCDTRVVRTVRIGASVKRERLCRHCGNLFNTYESSGS